MKKFFNTLAVFVGNLLRLKPVSWSKAQASAELMVATVRSLNEANLMNDEGYIVGQSPAAFFVDCALNALAFIVAVWLITQLITFFLVVLPYLLVAAAALWLIGYLLPSKGNAAVS